MSKNALKTNEFLKTGECIVSDNGAFYGIMQGDGNFCIYAGSGRSDRRTFVWGSLSQSRAGGDYFACMQPDGNFCVYGGTGPGDNKGLVWGTGSQQAGRTEYFICVTNFGELIVYRGVYPPVVETPVNIWRNNRTKNPPLSKAKVVELIQQYGPLLYFHPSENFLMTSVDVYLNNCTLHDDKTRITKKSPLPADLPKGERDGDRYWLEVDNSIISGNLSVAKAYVHVHHDIDRAYTDLQFWLFSAFNGPGTAFIKSWGPAGLVELNRGDAHMDPLGEHYSDWEHVSIRIPHATLRPESVFFSQHGGGQRLGYESLEHSNKQVVVYVSKNGHANYPKPGENFTEYRRYEGPFGTYMEFMLRNDTAKGTTFDCATNHEIISADWLEPKPAVPLWLDYPYRWGPISATTRITEQAVREILTAALGLIGLLLSYTPIGELAALIASIFAKDDRNGVEGPKRHGATWNGGD